jgi:hypothetical protein
LYGCWNVVKAADLDGDGDNDLVIGNLGINNRYRGDEKYPVTMVVSDFDNNGSTDCVISTYYNGVSSPLVTRDNLLDQMVFLKKKYLRYSDFSVATVNTMFTPEQLSKAQQFKANCMLSVFLINDGAYNFKLKNMPKEAQLSSIKSIVVEDVDNNGIQDVLLAGNEYNTEVETGRIDAGIGVLLKGSKEFKYKAVPVTQSGFFVSGDVRQIQPIKINGNNSYIVPRNRSELLFLQKK